MRLSILINFLQSEPIEAMATDPIHQFLLTNLQARQKLCEMEYASLIRVIESPKTQPFERGAALERRDALMREWAKITESLNLLDYDPPAKPVGAGAARDPKHEPRKSWNS